MAMITPADETAMAWTCLQTIHNSSLTYDDVAAAGPAVDPLEFPTASIHKAERVELEVRDARTGREHEILNVLVRLPHSGRGGKPPDVAYALRKKLSKSTFGSVYVCQVLRRSSEPGDVGSSWESRDEEYVAVKMSSFQRIRELRGKKNQKDPLKEAGALSLVSGSIEVEVMRDEDWMYTVLPYCPSGDLYSWFTRRKSVPPQVHETQARLWFRDLIAGLYHLQNKGVCHNDISLENILIDKNDRLTIGDFGLALRVPYTDTTNFGGVSDISEGNAMYRRLIRAQQGQAGNSSYLAPEILKGQAFDGFAVDLWASAVVLFIMLVGRGPFVSAKPTDLRYAQISSGGLKGLLKYLNIFISDSACHLLQNMLWADPEKRFTLSEVMNHPWVLDERPSITRATEDTGGEVATTKRDIPSSASKINATADTNPQLPKTVKETTVVQTDRNNKRTKEDKQSNRNKSPYRLKAGRFHFTLGAHFKRPRIFMNPKETESTA